MSKSRSYGSARPAGRGESKGIRAFLALFMINTGVDVGLLIDAVIYCSATGVPGEIPSLLVKRVSRPTPPGGGPLRPGSIASAQQASEPDAPARQAWKTSTARSGLS